MKKLITLLMLLPVCSFAQDALQEAKPGHPKNEIGLNTGIIFFADKKLSGRSPAAKFGAAYFRNFKQTQVGIRSTQYWHVIDLPPHLTAPKYVTDFFLSFPATIGIRYRFK